MGKFKSKQASMWVLVKKKTHKFLWILGNSFKGLAAVSLCRQLAK
jgi:hypothetical protein